MMADKQLRMSQQHDNILLTFSKNWGCFFKAKRGFSSDEFFKIEVSNFSKYHLVQMSHTVLFPQLLV